MSYTVIGGEPSGLARRLSRRLHAKYVGVRTRMFDDGEQKITLSSEPEGTAIVVQSTFPPVDTNLIRTLALIHKAKKSCDRGIAVIPYMGYARQDRELLAGELVTIRTVAKLLKAAGASKTITVDIHSEAALRQFGRSGMNVSAVPELARHVKRLKIDPLVVSPDAGGRARAGEFARLLDTDWIALDKKRDRRTGMISVGSAEVEAARDRDIVIVDDMVSTGGSVVKATKLLKGAGCERIFVACTHALLVGDADNKIRNAGVSEIFGTNTIPGTGTVDVSLLLAEAVLDA